MTRHFRISGLTTDTALWRWRDGARRRDDGDHRMTISERLSTDGMGPGGGVIYLPARVGEELGRLWVSGEPGR